MAKMPKRNKSKDNPYILGFDEDKKTYTVEFVDNKKVMHKIAISVELYKAFDSFELEDISQIHKFRKHIEHSEIYEETLNNRMITKPISIEDEVESKIMFEELKYAIDKLTDIQKRRIKMYYFEDMTLEQIAAVEGSTHQAISKSINKGIEEIKRIMKN